MRQMQKDEELKKRGAAAMGFDQDAATHHFLIRADGGAIQVTANAADAATVEQIRMHLKEIAASFARGEFDKPFATHGEVPPGVPVMQAKKQAINYRYEERPAGGAVVLSTTDDDALKAIHAFLRYQITEHKTGDPLQP